MGLRRYAEGDLPTILSRAVRWRWPGERLLATVPCEAEWSSSPSGPPEGPDDPFGGPDDPFAGGDDPFAARDEPPPRTERGLLGVTDARLVFQGTTRPGVSLRVSAAVFAGGAGIGYLSGEPPTAIAIGAGAALLLWLASRAAEALGAASGSLPRPRVLGVDRDADRIHAVDDWGTTCRLRLSRADLEQVADLLGA